MGKKKVVEKGLDTSGTKVEGASATQAGGSLKKKPARKLETGRVYIKSSYNNTSITVTDDKGDVVAWSSAGSMGFAGPKKATPFAASKVVSAIVEKIEKTGPKKVDLYISGIGPGRDSAVRSLAAQGFEIESIKDVTPLAHNGPKPRKIRRT
ncbi:MAG: 30S ribosomal protein S11 [Candidatus Colwellbacteria bacterium CG10_big_fil_rev_8_21_14_0_10_42_22]|uniref:Small ribosomal subunit protein uS11 n=1 Tax=Candidatus Colwellbacteria bacterium CG10_big_fil_rev_8_21_14_0_10_42_22 TaxID=1974540 RepID=A0A2H0VFG2_9BACT|nr:MAG: 30S ribosomal protein S11 [Candidatus Colwellbacteria bacterium CG10_big_fil_rev_8_21_14_0_10_42_22]